MTSSILHSLKPKLRFLGWVILLSLAAYGVLTHFVVMRVVVQGPSMMPTLREGETYLLNRLSYLCREPRRDELVVLRDPGFADCAVKRVVALPGESILIRNGQVFVNGAPANQQYLASGTPTYSEQAQTVLYVVGKNRYFVLGDNRPWSEDSRAYGAVHRRSILGTLARWKFFPSEPAARKGFDLLRTLA